MKGYIEQIIGVGTNVSFKVYWQSPSLPCPTLLAGGPAKEGGGRMGISQEVEKWNRATNGHSLAQTHSGGQK